MSTFKVTVERLEIEPHPNADALELAKVGGYRAVVRKGSFSTGDYALYIPEQAVLPQELIEELGLVGRLAGPNKDRVKAVRLRGELSQGIVCRPKFLQPMWDAYADSVANPPISQYGPYEAGYDYAEKLGITKWVPTIPAHLGGDVEAVPGMLTFPDPENIKRYPNIFTPGEHVIATEKIHGSFMTVQWDGAVRRVSVTSKGMLSKGLALKPAETNLYWRAESRYALGFWAELLANRWGFHQVAFFGEVYGRGVQDLHYGKDSSNEREIGYALFDIAFVREPGGVREFFLANDLWGEVAEFLADIPFAPIVFEGAYDEAVLMKRIEQPTMANAAASLEGGVMEGVVVRPKFAERISEETGSRAIAKFVSEQYLTRGNPDATEYE